MNILVKKYRSWRRNRILRELSDVDDAMACYCDTMTEATVGEFHKLRKLRTSLEKKLQRFCR